GADAPDLAFGGTPHEAPFRPMSFGLIHLFLHLASHTGRPRGRFQWGRLGPFTEDHLSGPNAWRTSMAVTLTYEDLKKKTVAELRDIAKGLTHEAVQGYTQMNKDHLLPALCKALGIEHAHHHVEASFDKSKIK